MLGWYGGSGGAAGVALPGGSCGLGGSIGGGEGAGRASAAEKAKSIGNHCGETALGFDEMGLMIMWPDAASLNTLRAFALSSEASSVREPPESERCTTCRRE